MRTAAPLAIGHAVARFPQGINLLFAGLIGGCSFAYWAEYDLAPVPSTSPGIEGVSVTGTLGWVPGADTPGEGFQGLCVEVSNATEDSVRLLWARAQFFDVDGAGFAVLPGDMNREAASSTVTVPPGATYEKFVLPVANRRRSMDVGQPDSHWWSCGTEIRYAARELVPTFSASPTRGAADRKAIRMVGRTFGFTVPVAVGTTEVTYRIFYKIDGYRIVHYVDL